MRYDISNIGEAIRKVQREHEINQADFADKIGANISTVSKWIRGVNDPPLWGLLAICEVYDVKLTELVKPLPDRYRPPRYKGGQNG